MPATQIGGLFSLSSERVDPPETIETGEVAISRTQDEPMFDGKRGQVGIRYEVGSAFRARHERRECFLVAFGG